METRKVTKMTFIGLGLLTIAWAIVSYTYQIRNASRTKVSFAGVFLLVMWDIFFLSLIVHEVYPRLKGRGQKENKKEGMKMPKFRKDRIPIPIVLAFYIGLWIFTATPLGILLLLAGATIIVVRMKMPKFKVAFIVLCVATITFFCCQKLIYRLYVAVAVQFLFAVWAIFLLKLFLEKVCPYIGRRRENI